ncbi:DUF6297 family protein, partial [Angustibacter aerolatus]
ASGARALALLGPVVRDPADVTWLLASPVDRRGMLVPSAALLLGVVTAAGAAVGALAGVLAHAVLAWTVAGAAAGLAVTAGAIVLQSRRAAHVVGPVADVLTLVAVGLLVSALLGVDLRDHGATRGTGTAAAAATVLAAVVLLALVPRRLSRLRRSDLVAGAGLALELRATVTALDGSFLAETLRTRALLQLGARGPARAIPLRGKGLGALIAADAVRVLRAPRPVLLAVGAAAPVWVVSLLYGRVLAVAATALLGWAAAGAAASGLRAVSRSAALARSLPFPTSDLVSAHAVLPLASAFVATAVATVLSGRPAWWAVAGALVGTAGAMRTARGRSPVSWQLQAASPVGALPVGAILSYLVGVDVVALVSVPWLAGADPALAAGVPLLALAVLRSLRPRRAD